jgi:hypothetical protein
MWYTAAENQCGGPAKTANRRSNFWREPWIIEQFFLAKGIKITLSSNAKQVSLDHHEGVDDNIEEILPLYNIAWILGPNMYVGKEPAFCAMPCRRVKVVIHKLDWGFIIW